MIGPLKTKGADLVIWRDLDEDGLTDPGELQTLSDHGIVSISLAATAVQETNEGNRVKFRSVVTHADGATASIDDAFFSVDQRDSSMRLPSGFTFTYEALGLPLLTGC